MTTYEKEMLPLLFLISCYVGREPANSAPAQHYNFTRDGVFELTSSNFKTVVLNSKTNWVVIFEYNQPICIPCEKLSVVVKQAVKDLKKKNTEVGVVSMRSKDNQKLVNFYKPVTYPRIFIIGQDKTNPMLYPAQVPQTPKDFLAYVDVLLSRPAPAEGNCGKDSQMNPQNEVYVLTDENFGEVVQSCSGPWMIIFYDPTNDLCGKFLPVYEKTAKDLKGQVQFGKIILANSNVAATYKVKDPCTMKLILTGEKQAKTVLDYNNGKLDSAMQAGLLPWVKTRMAAYPDQLGFKELKDDAATMSTCLGRGVSVCIILFLPATSKCALTCQLGFLTEMQQSFTRLKQAGWGWRWTIEGKQPAFQLAFGIKVFPSVLVVNFQSKTYSKSTSSLNPKKFKQFLEHSANDLVPQENLQSIAIPKIATV